MKYLLALTVSIAISFIAHKLIANPDLYFVIGGVDGIIMMLILRTKQ